MFVHLIALLGTAQATTPPSVTLTRSLGPYELPSSAFRSFGLSVSDLESGPVFPLVTTSCGGGDGGGSFNGNLPNPFSGSFACVFLGDL